MTGVHFERPLSAAQAGIWAGQRLNPGSALYNAAEYVEIRGALDSACLVEAIQIVMRSTPSLWMVIDTEAETTTQRYRATECDVARVDCRSTSDAHAEAFRWMQSDLSKPMNPAAGPLFRQALIQVEDDCHYWYQCIHHVLADGYSFALLLRQVVDTYEKLQGGMAVTPRSIEEALDAYDQLLAADEAYQTSTKANQDQVHWHDVLQAAPEVVSFSPSTEPPADRALRVQAHFSADEWSQLRQTWRAHWVQALIGSVAAVLRRRTGCHQPVLGLPVLGRSGSAALREPAMLMNIVPLVLSVDADQGLEGLAQAVGARLSADRPHHRYRYEELRRRLGRVGGARRLFGPIVNIMPFDPPSTLGGCRLNHHSLSAGPVEDVSFSCVPTADGGLRLTLEANPRRYDEREVDDLFTAWREQIRDGSRSPHAALPVDASAMAWLTGPDYEPVSAGQQLRTRPTVIERMQHTIQRHPDRPALETRSGALTYAELGRRVAGLADALRTNGVAAGDTVAVALPRGEPAVVTCLATLLAGGRFVFIDPEAPPARNARILVDLQPTLCVHSGQPVEWPGSQHSYQELQAEGTSCDWREMPVRNGAAYVIYTSGSSGTPKGVAIGHQALSGFVDAAIERYDIHPDDRVLQFAPLSFDACVEEMFCTFCQGACLVVRDDDWLESIPQFLQRCREYDISVLDLPTAFWHELVHGLARLGTPLPDALRTVIIGGEAVLPERVSQWHRYAGPNTRLFNSYGPSEATVVATATLLSPARPVHLGAPLAGRAIVVVDERLAPVPRGVAGELLLLGVGLADGYEQLPELTRGRFIELRLPWLDGPQRAYRTGDRVYVDAQGHLFYQGRLDDQIKISGYRIDPQEVETALVALPGVSEAAVVAQPLSDGVSALVAHLVCPGSDVPTVAEVHARLGRSLAAPMRPTRVVSHDTLPKNASGKLDRAALRQWPLKEVAPMPEADLTTLERQVLTVWREVLGHGSLAPEDDVFLSGGHSLQTIQVANRLSQQLGVEVPVALLFQHPTVHSLAQVLAQGDSRGQRETLPEALLRDCDEFEQALSAVSPMPSSGRPRRNAWLLTGATGFVGAHLLHRLLSASPDLRVVCLVRSDSSQRGYQRLCKAALKQGLNPPAADRVEVVPADLEQPDLGVDPERAEALFDGLDGVIHNAAITSVMRDYASLRAANTLSTGRLLALAAPRALPFHLVSTIAVAPPPGFSDGLPETFIDAHSGLADGYQQSKWGAEAMAAAAAKAGLPVGLYRLGRVTGSLDQGFVNPDDLIWQLLRLGTRQGILPDLAITEPWTPVDILARFIVAEVLSAESPGIYNLTPRQGVELASVYGWLNQAGYGFERLPLAQWCDRLRSELDRQDTEAQALLSFFEGRLGVSGNTGKSAAENAAFQARAEQHNLTLSGITRADFNRYLDYAQTQGWMPRPSTRMATHAE